MEQIEKQNQTQNVGLVTPDIPPILQKSKPQSTKYWIIGSIFIIIGGLAIIWFIYNKAASPQNTSSKSPMVVQTPSSESNTKTLERKSLNTTRLSLEYPSDWTISTQSGLFIQSPDTEFYGIEIGFIDFEDYAEILVQHPDNKRITVDGRRAIRYTESFKQGTSEGHYDSIMIEQPIGIFLISGTGVTDSVVQRNADYLDALITSVRFKKFTTNGCGGIDTQGELVCSCNGDLIKPLPPIGGLGHDAPVVGSSTCMGTCGTCCYSGKAQQSEFPTCLPGT